MPNRVKFELLSRKTTCYPRPWWTDYHDSIRRIVSCEVAGDRGEIVYKYFGLFTVKRKYVRVAPTYWNRMNGKPVFGMPQEWLSVTDTQIE